MNVGIIIPSDRNFYSSTLLAKMISINKKPTLVICTEKSKALVFFGYAKRKGIKKTFNRILSRYSISDSGNDEKHYLRKYAIANNLENWNFPVKEICSKEAIAYVRFKNINSDESVKFIENNNTDLLINTGGDLFKKNVIESVKKGSIQERSCP